MEAGEQEHFKELAAGAKRSQNMNDLELYLKEFRPCFGNEEELVKWLLVGECCETVFRFDSPGSSVGSE